MSEEQVVEKTPEQVQVEKEARLMGWVDKGEYRDGDHWVDAETFVKRGKEINPILRKNNETLLKKLEQRDAELEELKKTAKEFRQFTKENADRKVKELETELKALRERKKEAISEGNGEAVLDIDDAIDAVKEEQASLKKVSTSEPEPKSEPKQEIDKELVTWMGENKWFGADQELTQFADVYGKRIARMYPELSGKAFLDKLDEELQQVLPEEYRKQVRTSPVESGTRGTARPTKGKHNYDNLPPDAQAACDRYVKQGLMTQEEYLAEYDWE